MAEGETFEDFYRRYRPAVRRFAVRWVGEDRADDVMQAVMMRALRCFDTLDLSIDARPWLATVVRRVSVDLHRTDDLMPRATGTWEPAAAADPLRTVLARDECRTVGRRLRRMSWLDREMLVAHVFDGVPQDELARRYGLTVGAVRSRLFRTRRKLLCRGPGSG